MARTKAARGKKRAKASIRDRARQAAGKRERGGGGLDTLKNLPQDVEFFKPKMGRGKKGQNRLSIVPYTVSIDNHPFQEVGEQWPECTYWQHKVGNGSDQKRFICLAKTEQSQNKKCPICEYRKALLDSGSDPALAEELKPKQRQLFNVYDHDNENKGVQIFEMSPYMFGFMLDDEDTAQAEDFSDKYYGDDVDGLMVVARFQEGMYKNPECARIDFEERDDLDESIVEDAIDFDACLRILSYDELNEKFFELDTGGEEEEDEEEDEPKTRSKSKSAPSRRKGKTTKKEPEPDEDEQEEDEDEDEEDDFPTEDEINKMKSIALKKLIEEHELDVDPDGLKLSELRSAIIEECYPDEEEDEDDEAEDNECPEGMTFGVDCDTEDCCDDCDKWEDCKDLQDEIEEAASKKKGKRSKR